jgi:hypothetical protein
MKVSGAESLPSAPKFSKIVCDHTQLTEQLIDGLPLELTSFITQLRPLMRREVFDTFALLLIGILIGEAKYRTVRSSVFANGHY